MTPHPPTVDIVRARPLLGFREAVATLGGDASVLLTAAGLPPDGDARAGEALSYRQVAELLERTAQTLVSPDFGMLLARRQGAGALFGPLGKAMRSAATLGEALRCGTTFSHLHSPAAAIWLMPRRQGQEVLVGHDILVQGLVRKTQTIEMVLLTGCLTIHDLTGGRVRQQGVMFRHQPAASPAAYRRHFGSSVLFGQHADAIILARDDLACPLPTRDEAAHREALTVIETRFAGQASPLHVRVRGVVTHFLATGACSKELVAAELDLHPRTLHRRLAEEGTSFRQIRDDVRRDLLHYCLAETGLDLSGISEVLGFAEQSVLTRFCRSRLGAAPSQMLGRLRRA